MMTKKEVKQVLNSPSLTLVRLALDLVNLKEKERKAIELVDMKGLTEFQASELMKISTKTISNYRRKGLDKCLKCWSNQNIIQKILELQ